LEAKKKSRGSVSEGTAARVTEKQALKYKYQSRVLFWFAVPARLGILHLYVCLQKFYVSLFLLAQILCFSFLTGTDFNRIDSNYWGDITPFTEREFYLLWQVIYHCKQYALTSYPSAAASPATCSIFQAVATVHSADTTGNRLVLASSDVIISRNATFQDIHWSPSRKCWKSVEFNKVGILSERTQVHDCNMEWGTTQTTCSSFPQMLPEKSCSAEFRWRQTKSLL